MAVDNFLPGAPLLPAYKGGDLSDLFMDMRRQDEQERADSLKAMMFKQRQDADLEREKSIDARSAATDARLRGREDRLDREHTAQIEAQRRAEIGKQLPDIEGNLENPDLVRARLGSLGLPYTETPTKGPAPQLGATPPAPLGPTQVEEGPQETPEEAQAAGLERAARAVPGDASTPEQGAAADQQYVDQAQAERQRFAQANNPDTVAANQAQIPAHQAMQQFYNQRAAAFPAEQQAYNARPALSAFDVNLPGGQSVKLDPYEIRANREAAWKRTADKWAQDNTFMSPGEPVELTNKYVHLLHGEISNGMDPTAADKQLKEFIVADDKKAFLAAMLGQKQDFTWRDHRQSAGEAMDRTQVLASGRNRIHDEEKPKKEQEAEDKHTSAIGKQIKDVADQVGFKKDLEDLKTETKTLSGIQSVSTASQWRAVGGIVKGSAGPGAISDKEFDRYYGKIAGVLKVNNMQELGDAVLKGDVPQNVKDDILTGTKQMILDSNRRAKKFVRALDEKFGDDPAWRGNFRKTYESYGLAEKTDPEKEKARAAVKLTGNPSDIEDFRRVYGEEP